MRNRLFVLLTVAAIASAAEMTRADEPLRDATPLLPAARSAPGSALVGKRVRVDVGSVVDLPSETAGPRPSALRDIAIAGAQFTEVTAERQETPQLVPAPRSHFEGDIERFDNDILMVRLLGHSQVVTVPRAAITSLRVRQNHSHAGRGALIAAAVPVAFSLACFASDIISPPKGEDIGYAPFGLGVLFAAPPAAALGAIIGSQMHYDRWERVDPRSLSVAVVPDPRGGIRGRLAIRF